MTTYDNDNKDLDNIVEPEQSKETTKSKNKKTEKIEKERLDVLLVQQGLATSRELAKAYIMAGNVYINNIKEEKAGTKIDVNSNIEVRGNQMKYVSRGGYKLEKAIDSFGIDLNNTICLDVGASTGGFTDCMLQNGAIKVYSIDVGYGQFAWKLRTDDRVVCLEKTNVRYITSEEVPDLADFTSIDVSFISLTKVLLPVLNIMRENGQLICLIKPQFEAGREKVGKKGVVRDKAVHLEVIEKIIDFAFISNILVLGIDFSPIKGPEGNIEYLIYLEKNGTNTNSVPLSKEESFELASNIVNLSHKGLA